MPYHWLFFKPSPKKKLYEHLLQFSFLINYISLFKNKNKNRGPLKKRTKMAIGNLFILLKGIVSYHSWVCFKKENKTLAFILLLNHPWLSFFKKLTKQELSFSKPEVMMMKDFLVELTSSQNPLTFSIINQILSFKKKFKKMRFFCFFLQN